MTINGTITNTQADAQYWTFKLEVEELSLSVEDNTSVVRVEAFVGRKSTAGTSYMTNADMDFSYSVGGVQKTNHYHVTTGNIVSGAFYKVGTETFTVPHDPDGTKTAIVSVSFTNDLSPHGGSASGSVALAAIPRASVPTLYGQNAMNEKVQISSFNMGGDLKPYIWVDTNRVSENFTHKLYLVRQGESDVLLADDLTDSYQTTRNSFLQYCPNSATLDAAFKLVTYNGETLIGENSLIFTATISNLYGIGPQIYGIGQSLPDNSAIPQSHREDFDNMIISGVSRIGFIVPFGNTYAYATKAKCYLNGNKIWENGDPSGAVYIVPPKGGTAPDYNVSYVFTLEDSRGFTASYTMNLTIYPYEKPALIPYSGNDAILANRGTANSFDPQSKELRLELERAVSSVGGVNKSTVICTVAGAASGTVLDENDGDTFSGLLPTASQDYLSLSQAYNVMLEIADYISVSATTYTFSVPVGFATLHLKSDGDGVGIGKYAEQTNGLDIAFDTYFGGSVKIWNGSQFVDITQKLLNL